MNTQPTTLDDPLFGFLKWDPDTEWWEGRLPTEDAALGLSVEPISPSDRRISEAARQSFTKFTPDLKMIRDRDLREYARLCIEWGGKPVPVEDLLTRMMPDEIMIRSDGYFEITFTDITEEIYEGYQIVSRFWPNGLHEVLLEG